MKEDTQLLSLECLNRNSSINDMEVLERPIRGRGHRAGTKNLAPADSRKIKDVQKHIVRETTALAGATTKSLRNIELVKSLGLAQQEVARLNATTGKILKLELKKVRYLRSLSFVQGSCVNLLRTSILFLMLYLVFRELITVGQFFSLWIYSFFIFGPLQEHALTQVLSQAENQPGIRYLKRSPHHRSVVGMAGCEMTSPASRFADSVRFQRQARRCGD